MCSVNAGRGGSIATLQPTSIGASLAGVSGAAGSSVGSLLTNGVAGAAKAPGGNTSATASTSQPPGSGGTRQPQRKTLLA